MSISNFTSAEIKLMIHATEDTMNVLSAIKKVLQIEPEEFTANSIKGHFGNIIILFKAILNSKRATEIAYKIIDMMSNEDRFLMYNDFDLYIDAKNSIYLRISKQKLFERKVVLEQTDSLKIKLKFVRSYQSRSEIQNFRRMLIDGDGD
tara:strand:- start:1038 stop:1484 length:447 start_codon:yes stop_codon:yes gene_type:complete